MNCEKRATKRLMDALLLSVFGTFLHPELNKLLHSHFKVGLDFWRSLHLTIRNIVFTSYYLRKNSTHETSCL